MKTVLKMNEETRIQGKVSPSKKESKPNSQFDSIFVPPVIVEEYNDNKCEILYRKDPELSNFSENRKKIVSPRDMFFVNEDPVRNIYLLGEAGRGKSEFCMHLLKNWCNAKRFETDQQGLNEWERSLGEFDLVYLLTLRNEDKLKMSLMDMICSDISENSDLCIDDVKTVLSSERRKCLLIIDGLDQWKRNEGVKEKLVNKAITDIDRPACFTIMFTYRPWIHAELAGYISSSDKVLEIQGFDEKGMESAIKHYYRIMFDNEEEDRTEFENKIKDIILTAEKFKFDSILRIPSLVCDFLYLYHGEQLNENKITDFYMALVNRLINSQDGELYTGCSELLTKLGEFAYKNLIEGKTSAVLSDVQSSNILNKADIELALMTGLLSAKRFEDDKVKVIFFHEIIQEFLASYYMVCSREEKIGSSDQQSSSVNLKIDNTNVEMFMKGLQNSHLRLPAPFG